MATIISFVLAGILFLLVLAICAPLWCIGLALNIAGMRMIRLGHWLHYYFQKGAKKLAEKLE
jgi:hypothetical protein